MHTEGHEEIIFNHLDGSLDERNVVEALSLLSQCRDCKAIYDKSLRLKSKIQPANVLHYLAQKERRETAVEKPRLRLWPAWPQLQWATALILVLALVLPVSWYTYHLGGELRQKDRALRMERAEARAALAQIKEENQRLKGEVQRGEGEKLATVKSPTRLDPQGSAPLTLASVELPAKIFSHSSEVTLSFPDLRGSKPSPTGEVELVQFPKDSDLLHLILMASEERPYNNYRIEMIDSKGKRVFRSGPIKKDGVGNFNLYFQKGALADQEYTIKIYGLGLEPRAVTPISQQRIRISP